MGRRNAGSLLASGKEEHIVQQPNILLAILSKMALKPEVKFDQLYPKLYNVELWLLAYQHIAPKAGNMTAGTDGKTIDGVGLKLINELINDLKTSRYKPHPVRRVYLPKPDGKLRPIGIPSFRDKLLQTVIKFILEAIYEPLFTDTSHGFRPHRSCHTALEQVKKMNGVRYWVEGDIKGFFDNLGHSKLIQILSKRITDQRLLHLLEQFLKAGYVEDWKYHQTYSGVPQGGCLSPVLSNIYLNELDQKMQVKMAEFNRGKKRQRNPAYHRISMSVSHARKRARLSGQWHRYKILQKQELRTQPSDPQDPSFRRLLYCRYADDTLFGIIGSKAEAVALKEWLASYLRDELGLELSPTKTLITHAAKRVRFLGYDIKRWSGERIYRFRTSQATVTKRTGNYALRLLVPHAKTISFAKEYGNPQVWRGEHRSKLIRLSELEILKTYNAEVRGFLNYYVLADNFTDAAQRVLHITTSSFYKTLANKRKSTFKRVIQSLKRGPGHYILTVKGSSQETRNYALVATVSQILESKQSRENQPDQKVNTHPYRCRNELGKRLMAKQCEWCGSTQGQMEVHHVRKLGNLKGKTSWERQMMERKRKTMVLCVQCHDELHAGKLKEKKKYKTKRERASQLRGNVYGWF